jgi:hypothetical protein
VHEQLLQLRPVTSVLLRARRELNGADDRTVLLCDPQAQAFAERIEDAAPVAFGRRARERREETDGSAAVDGVLEERAQPRRSADSAAWTSRTAVS